MRHDFDIFIGLFTYRSTCKHFIKTCSTLSAKKSCFINTKITNPEIFSKRTCPDKLHVGLTVLKS